MKIKSDNMNMSGTCNGQEIKENFFFFLREREWGEGLRERENLKQGSIDNTVLNPTTLGS